MAYVTPGDLPDSRAENRQRAEAIVARGSWFRTTADWYDTPAGRTRAAQAEQKRSHTKSGYRPYRDRVRAESRTCINCDCLDSDHSNAIDIRPCLNCADCIMFQQAPPPKQKANALVIGCYIMSEILFIINAALAFSIGGLDRAIVMSALWLFLYCGCLILMRIFLTPDQD